MVTGTTWYLCFVVKQFRTPDADGAQVMMLHSVINPLTPNAHYICRTAPLTSRRCILNIYSTNICTEYFKHAA
jgi:hypothetical protein